MLPIFLYNFRVNKNMASVTIFFKYILSWQLSYNIIKKIFLNEVKTKHFVMSLMIKKKTGYSRTSVLELNLFQKNHSKIKTIFSLFQRLGYFCLINTFTLFAALNASLFFSIGHFVDFDIKIFTVRLMTSFHFYTFCYYLHFPFQLRIT